MKLAAEGYYMKIKLNIFALFFVIASVQAQPNDSFKELFDRARKLEKLKDVIKDEKYYEQRACFIRGNCQHPMDTLAQSLNNNQLTITKFVKMIHQEQEKGIISNALEEKQISDFNNKMDEYKNVLKQLPIEKIEYKSDIDKKLSPRIKKKIDELHKEYKIAGKFNVDANDFEQRFYFGPLAIIRSSIEGGMFISFPEGELNQLQWDLFLGGSFFALTEDDQEAVIEHEFAHRKNNDGYRSIIRKSININNRRINHLTEFVADQFPASKNVRTAKLLEGGYWPLLQRLQIFGLPITVPT